MEVMEVSVEVMEACMEVENHLRTWKAGIKEIEPSKYVVEASADFFYGKDQATVGDFIVGPRLSAAESPSWKQWLPVSCVSNKTFCVFVEYMLGHGIACYDAPTIYFLVHVWRRYWT